MGCGLPKLKRSEDNSPGKIYSTLKRPQVQIKVGVAYTYHFLDFLLGTEEPTGSSSMLRLSSVRDLPGQLHDLYLQGFVLVAVHPFVHTCGPDSIQRQLHRAVLIRLSDSSEKAPQPCETHYLQTDLVMSAVGFPDSELIQGYVKKVQDIAELGGFFVGFLHHPKGGHCVPERDEPEDLSLSLHSSPRSALREWSDQSQNQSPEHQSGPEDQNHVVEIRKGEQEDEVVRDGPGSDGHGNSRSEDCVTQQDDRGPSPAQNRTDTDSAATCDDSPGAPARVESQAHQSRVELFALFSHMEAPSSPPRYYTVKVPLCMRLHDSTVCGVDADWLDHMTQHFSNGASLVDAYFHLGDDSDSPAKSVESVFVFQEGDPAKPVVYDAIVVEQWTVVNDFEVKTDYVPLLQSLALYGWRLTCVLPTPVVKSNSDGSLATKQILFLQRPVLARKNKEPKRLSLRARSKSNKNSVKDAPKNKNCSEGLLSATERDEEEDRRTEKTGARTGRGESETGTSRNDRNTQNDKSSGEGLKQEQRKGGSETGTGAEEDKEAEAVVQEENKGGCASDERVAVELANEDSRNGVNDTAGSGATEDMSKGSMTPKPVQEHRNTECAPNPDSMEGHV